MKKPLLNSEDNLGLSSNWTYRFKSEGKKYTLFKRNPSRDGSWWLEVVIRGKRIVRSLDTNNAAAAENRAINQFIRPAKAGNWNAVDKSRLRDVHPNIGQVIAAYQQMSVGRTAPLTVRNNINSFRLVIRRGLGDDNMKNETVDACSTSKLTGKLVADFEDWMSRQALAQNTNIESKKRSVCGYLRQSRSLFKATALPRYPELGVALPDVKDFMERAVEKPARLVKHPPNDDLLKRTFEASMELRKTDRPVYVALLVGLCSLRRGEISRMRWDWVVSHFDRWCIVVPAEVAKSKAARVIPIDARVREELESFKSIRQQGSDLEEEMFVLPSPRLGQGGPGCRLRAQNVFKRLNVWMRAQGWKTNHTLHEMRALALGWVRDGHGLDAAQAVAGHADQRTTQAHYVGQKTVRNVTITLPLEIGGAPAS